MKINSRIEQQGRDTFSCCESLVGQTIGLRGSWHGNRVCELYRNSIRPSSRQRFPWRLARQARLFNRRRNRQSGILHPEWLSLPDYNLSHSGSSLSDESVASPTCASIERRASRERPAKKFRRQIPVFW